MSEDRKWMAESESGQFVIDRADDGGLILIDHALLDPDDDDCEMGIFAIMPENSEEFLAVMRKALELDSKGTQGPRDS
jgi:hypothetical protein